MGSSNAPLHLNWCKQAHISFFALISSSFSSLVFMRPNFTWPTLSWSSFLGLLSWSSTRQLQYVYAFLRNVKVFFWVCRLNHADILDWWGICTSRDVPLQRRRKDKSIGSHLDGLCLFRILVGARPPSVSRISQPNTEDFGCIYQDHSDRICRFEAVCRWSWPFLHNLCLYPIWQGRKVWSACFTLFDRGLHLFRAACWWPVVRHLHSVFWRHEKVSCIGRYLADWRFLWHSVGSIFVGWARRCWMKWQLRLLYGSY